MTALGGVVFTTALTGMAIAVALSLLAILYQASRPYIAVLGRIPGDPPVFADVERHDRRRPIEGFLILRPNVPLTFVNADVAKDQVMAQISARPEPPRALVLDIGATADFDVATMDMLAALSLELGRLGDRPAAEPGPRLGPRPDAPVRPDDDHRRGPLLPVRRGGRRRAAARPADRVSCRDAVLTVVTSTRAEPVASVSDDPTRPGDARRARDRDAVLAIGRPDRDAGHDHDADDRDPEHEDVGRAPSPARRPPGSRPACARATTSWARRSAG